MTDPNRTHIAFLLDRSGSMRAIKDATENGFNAFIAEQRELPGNCTVTLAQFDDIYDELYVDRPLADVPPLDLQPRGTTALLDSIARIIRSTGQRLADLAEHRRPGSVIVAIMTDGLENSSREMDHGAIKAMITHQEETYGWTFLYLGANQDAIEVGGQIGVSADRSMTYFGHNADAAMAATSSVIGAYRDAVASGMAPAAARAASAYSDRQREQATKA